jgi:uncharacterized protein (TIGR02246 family)
MQNTAETTTPTNIAETIVERLEQAWNDADGAAFGAEFTDESDFVNVRGEHHRGATAIGRGHQGIFDTIYAGSTVRFELELARPLAPGLVLAILGSTLDVPAGPLQGVHNARMTLVIAEQDGRWAITAFHNTLVAAS